MRYALILLCMFGLSACAPMHPVAKPSEDGLAIRVYPQVGMAPMEVRVTVTHTPSEDDRSLDIGFFCGSLRMQGSTWSLNGVEEPKRTTRSYVLDGCGSGRIDVYATLHQSDDRIAFKQTTVEIR